MKSCRRSAILRAGILVSVGLLSALPVAAQVADRQLGFPDAHWESVSQPHAIDQRILTEMDFGGDLIVAGEFHAAGGVLLNHIGKWDGAEWRPLGEGFNHTVRCLGMYQGRLIAGGDFTASGNRPMSHIAIWDGREWQAMGEGLDSSPRSLVEWNGGLVAGGWFAVLFDERDQPSEVAFATFWDGTSWAPMGQTIITGRWGAPPGAPCRDLVVYRGSLYAAGVFEDINGFHRPVAKWNGSDWVPSGPHIDQPLGSPAATCFVVWDSLLVVGGSFTRVDSMEAHGVASFDGQSWRALGTNLVPAVLDVQVHKRHLFASGYGGQGNSIVEYDGASWKTVDGAPRCVRALASYDGWLFAGGAFSSNQIAAWTGTAWLDVPATRNKDSIVTDPILLLMSYQDHVLALPDRWPYGWMDEADLLTPSNVDRAVHEHHASQPEWSEWSYFPWTVFQGDLFFGLQQWDGANFTALQVPPCGPPTALATINDRIYAASMIYDYPTSGCSGVIAAWDGQRWALVADGLASVPHDESWEGYHGVRALAGYKDQVIVGGFFSFNDTGRNLAAWNGTSWDSLDGCPNNLVTCVTNYHDDLIAAGFFDRVGQVTASCIARWDGNQWHPLGLGVDGPIYTMTVHNGRLIVGGSFEHAGGMEAGSIAAWDGAGWVALDSGIDGEVLTMVSNQGILWVGGEFSKAGGQTSFHLAKWIEGPRSASFSNIIAQRTRTGITIEASATYVPFDQQGFLVYRQAQGEPQVTITPAPISDDQFFVTDATPPLGPVTYVIAGIASTGSVTPYASTQVAADPALRFALLPISPNPFQAQATITFHNAQAGPVRVAVFDLRGRLVAELLDGTVPPGAHSLTWNGRDTSGRAVAAGTYFCRVAGSEGSRVERLVRSTP